MRNGKGAAPAAPAAAPADELARADQWEAEALAAIDAVQTPAEAESLLARVATVAEVMRISEIAGDRERRWRAMKLRVEYRYGELLGPAEPGGNKSRVTGSYTDPPDRMQASRARMVAAIDRDDFESYVETEPEPSRAGLLRKHGPPPKTPPRRRKGGGRKAKDAPTVRADQGSPAYSDEVVDWVKRRRRQGWTRDQIVAASKAGEDGFPTSESWRDGLSNGGVTTIDAIIWHIERFESERFWRRPNRSGGRLREIAAARKAPTYPPLIDLQQRVSKLTAALETARVALNYNVNDEPLDVVNDLHDDLIEVQWWIDEALALTGARLSDAEWDEKIAKLRDTRGRTDAEAETARRLADNLERKRDRQLD